ncbi:MAG: hypothetical protein R2750_07620 [Bacteroidales bacterium]
MIGLKKLAYVFSFSLILCVSLLNAQELSTSSKKAQKAYEAGESAYRINDLESAEYFFKQAVEIDHEFFEAWIVLGEIYEEQKLDTNAIVAYQKRWI